MAIVDLLATLERVAGDETHALRAVADADAAGIDAESARVREQRLAAAIRETTDGQRAIAEGRCADAQRAHRRATLDARAAMLARIREAVRAELPALVDEAVRARLRAALSRHVDDTAVVHETPTGFVAELAGGTRVDATLDAILEHAWPRLATHAIALVDAEES